MQVFSETDYEGRSDRMSSEVLQLVAALGFFLIVAVAWLFIIYIPGRTMESSWSEDPPESPVESDPKL